jgi:serine/threonine-protein kinase HipA
MTAKELTVLLAERRCGRVTMDRSGRLAFAYDDLYRAAPDAIELSLSMPLSAGHHGHDRIEPFLRGLLPDSDVTLAGWGRRFHVSPRNPFALLSHVGEDCAGAVQLLTEERLRALDARRGPDIEWLDEPRIAERLRQLRVDPSASRTEDDAGQFSLAGAQPKIALFHDGERWGLPSGRTPTTHILKPPNPEYDGHCENEHLCLSLARAVGLPVAASEVQRFEDQVAIVVTRFDRVSAVGAPSSVLRVHQEDLCQALAVRPDSKYENEGGPGAVDIAGVLRAHSSRAVEDTSTFAQALMFQWLIVGTDAHAKNYALLHAGRGRVRLAPFYDIASFMPYRREHSRLKLAMRVGREYRVGRIGREEWEDLAGRLRVDADELIERLTAMAREVAERAGETHAELRGEGLTHPIVESLASQIRVRAEECLRAVQRPAKSG